MAERLSTNRHFGVGLARATGGAVIFALPLLMTMEMWNFGFHMDPLRLALLLIVNVPLLVGLSHFSGFEETFELLEDGLDAFVAYAVGFVASALILGLVGVLTSDLPVIEVVSTVALQAVPASVGALLAQSQFGGAAGEKRDADNAGDTPGRARPTTYVSQLFLMAAGALFLAFNVAPTEEIPMIAYMINERQALLMVVLSLVAMHAFVYAVQFRGQKRLPEGASMVSVFLRFTVVGYALALVISAYILWTFGRLDDVSDTDAVTIVIVLGFPAAIGAAAARLLL